MRLSKSSLAVMLSKASVFSKAKIELEQYPTDSETAASFLWLAFNLDDIQDKIIADFGCGTGILGLGAAILGAKKIYMIDTDEEALELAKKNKEEIEEKLGTKFSNIFFLHKIRSKKTLFC